MAAARAVLQGPPDVAELQASAAAWGLRLEVPEHAVPLWAELVPAVNLFAAMRTQWVRDVEGKPALNYAALTLIERRVGISTRRQRQVFADLQVMEIEGRHWFMTNPASAWLTH